MRMIEVNRKTARNQIPDCRVRPKAYKNVFHKVLKHLAKFYFGDTYDPRNNRKCNFQYFYEILKNLKFVGFSKIQISKYLER